VVLPLTLILAANMITVNNQKHLFLA